jgi:hypothetical protein
MSVQQSSIDGFVASKASRSKHVRAILNTLRAAGPASAGYNNRQLARIIGQPINVVTPATLELRRRGLVVLAGRRKDVYSGVTVMFWRVATPEEAQAVKDTAAQPRSWATLAYVPEGVIVKEAMGWLWQNVGDGNFTSSASTGEKWSAPEPLSHGEKDYGPVTEVKV